jgi:hypothetical protein
MEPRVNQRGTDHDEKRNDYPENNPSEDNGRHSLGLTVFPRRPFLVPVHGRLGLTEASPLLSVNILALQGDHSRIVGVLF